MCNCCCSNGSAALAELPEQQQAALLQCHFLFSLVWSIGANTDDEGRKTFDGLLRKLLAGDAPPQLADFITAPEVSSCGDTSTAEPARAPQDAPHHHCWFSGQLVKCIFCQSCKERSKATADHLL